MLGLLILLRGLRAAAASGSFLASLGALVVVTATVLVAFAIAFKVFPAGREENYE